MGTAFDEAIVSVCSSTRRAQTLRRIGSHSFGPRHAARLDLNGDVASVWVIYLLLSTAFGKKGRALSDGPDANQG
jgi:hypothetical protein